MAHQAISHKKNFRVPFDKSEGSVKDEVILCGAQAPLGLPKVEGPDAGNSTLNHPCGRSTNHRFGHDCGHDSSMRTSRRCGMREHPINHDGLAHWPSRGTRGLLSMRTISGCGFWVRSIQ